VNITELIVEIAKETGLPRAEVAQVLQAFIDITKRTVLSGERLMMRSFGAFYPAKLKHRSRPIIRFKEARPWRSTVSSSTTRR
jgi:nucleoid DNA-binding protein